MPAGGLVVEIGCGTGRLLREFRGCRTLGVDPALPMLRQARGLRVVRGVAEALPLGSSSADLAFASLAFHHFNPCQAQAVMRQIGRIGHKGFIVNDIYRSQGAWYMAWFLAHMTTTNRLTRHDGRARHRVQTREAAG